MDNKVKKNINNQIPHLFLLLDALDEESVGIVPRQEDFLDNIAHSLFLEAQVLSSYYGGVDEVHSQCIRSVRIHNLYGIGVVLQTFTHLLSVPVRIQFRLLRLATAIASQGIE
jgi:hypothetical protein